jgi:DoxX-like family
MQMTMTDNLETSGARATHRANRASVGGRIARGAVRVAAGLASFFLLFDGGARLVGFGPYVQGTIEAGYGAHLAPVIGAALLISTILYVIPRTAVLGAVLVTGYLGGAVATNLRVMDASPWIAFPMVLGALMWLDLFLRDWRVRGAIISPR